MVRIILALTLLVLTGTAFIAGTLNAGAAPGEKPATMWVEPFHAVVHQGPDAGLKLNGTLHLQIQKDQVLVGSLVQDHASRIRAIGQVRGLAVNLYFELGTNREIFAFGMFAYNKELKQWRFGGSIVGPRRGDAGDWPIQGTNNNLFNLSSIKTL